jgi:hypothetical protein
MLKKFLMGWIGFLMVGVGVAQADIPLPGPRKDSRECRYMDWQVIQANGCGSTQICTAQVVCGVRTMPPVFCLAKNGRCPTSPRDCIGDRQGVRVVGSKHGPQAQVIPDEVPQEATSNPRGH